jgi:hypothetical protein
MGLHRAAHLVVDQFDDWTCAGVRTRRSVLTAQISVATNSTGPGSPVARAFSATAQKLDLNAFFDARLLAMTGR